MKGEDEGPERRVGVQDPVHDVGGEGGIVRGHGGQRLPLGREPVDAVGVARDVLAGRRQGLLLDEAQQHALGKQVRRRRPVRLGLADPARHGPAPTGGGQRSGGRHVGLPARLEGGALTEEDGQEGLQVRDEVRDPRDGRTRGISSHG